MTSLVFDLEPEIVCIAMDTLVTTVDKNEPHHFCSKMFLLPHLGSVMCGTGNMGLAVEWFEQIHHNFFSDVCDLNRETPDRLRRLSQCLSQSSTCTDTTPSANLEGKIFHFGYSPKEKKYKGFVYKSKNEFSSKEIPPGFNYQPSLASDPTTPEIQNEREFIDTAIKVMKLQQAEQQLSADSIIIGGQVQVLTMKPNIMQIKIVHSFDDFNELHKQMCQKNPIS